MKRTLAFALLLALVSQTAHAVLINLGDTTLDTRTRLEWLDLTETQGLSFEDVIGGAGGYLNDGWKIANGAQVDDLFFRYSLFVPERDDVDVQIAPEASVAQHLNSLRLVALLGPTISFNMPGGAIVIDDPLDPRQIAVSGFYDDGAGGQRVGLGSMTVRFEWDFAPQQCQYCVDWNTFDDFIIPSQSYRAQGTFLVRQVPEPGSALLFGIGLAAMGFARGRKRPL